MMALYPHIYIQKHSEKEIVDELNELLGEGKRVILSNIENV